MRRPRPDSLKLFFMSWIIFVFLLEQNFTCNLRAYLMLVDTEAPVNNIDDLLKAGKRLVIPRRSAITPLLKYSSLPSFQAIFKQISANGDFAEPYDSEELTRAQLKEGFSKIALDSMMLFQMAKYVRSHDREQPFYQGRDVIFPFYGGMVVPKGSIWKADFDAIVRRLKEGGIIEQIILSYVPLPFLSKAKSTPHPEPFTVDHLLGTGFIFLAGLTLSFLAFLGEVLVNNI